MGYWNIARSSCVALALLIPTAASMSAQGGPIVIGNGGLVNVTIVDVIDDITIRDINVNVAAAVNIAANVCNVAVGVIADDLLEDGQYTCSTAEQVVTIGPFDQ